MQPANSVNIQDQAYVVNFQPGHVGPGFTQTNFMQPSSIPNTFITQNPPLPLQFLVYNPWMNFNQISSHMATNQITPNHIPTSTFLIPQLPTPTGSSLSPPQIHSSHTLLTQPLTVPRLPPSQMFVHVPSNSSTFQTSNSSFGHNINRHYSGCYSSSEGANTENTSTCAGLSVGRSRTPEVPESLKKQYEQATTSAGRGRGRTFVQTPPSQQKGVTQRKYPHRSKQRKIESTTRWIKTIAENRDVFAAPRELVRGRRTFQCPAKTFQACKDVKVAFQKVLENENIQIVRIACPFSKKNEFQKKGFILYVKVENEVQVRLAEKIFMDEGLKVRRAVSKEERLKIEAENASIAMGCLDKLNQVECAPPAAAADCGILCERKNSSRKNSSIDDSTNNVIITMKQNYDPPESALQKNCALQTRSQFHL